LFCFEQDQTDSVILQLEGTCFFLIEKDFAFENELDLIIFAFLYLSNVLFVLCNSFVFVEGQFKDFLGFIRLKFDDGDIGMKLFLAISKIEHGY